MINDFKACGGFLMIATGFRMIKVKEFPIADMIPAMVIVMPISWLWVNYITNGYISISVDCTKKVQKSAVFFLNALFHYKYI